MIIGRQKKTWNVTAKTDYCTILMPIDAATLPGAFRKFARHWHMEDVLEISITEVKSDERSEGISGADQTV